MCHFLCDIWEPPSRHITDSSVVCHSAAPGSTFPSGESVSENHLRTGGGIILGDKTEASTDLISHSSSGAVCSDKTVALSS